MKILARKKTVDARNRAISCHTLAWYDAQNCSWNPPNMSMMASSNSECPKKLAGSNMHGPSMVAPVFPGCEKYTRRMECSGVTQHVRPNATCTSQRNQVCSMHPRKPLLVEPVCLACPRQRTDGIWGGARFHYTSTLAQVFPPAKNARRCHRCGIVIVDAPTCGVVCRFFARATDGVLHRPRLHACA